MLETVIGAMLAAREGLLAEFMHLHRRMLAIVRADAVCRQLMTAPGVSALVSITFKTAVDDPGRFRSSKAVGAHFRLTPMHYQSGETDVTGGISKVGDAMAGLSGYYAWRSRPASAHAKADAALLRRIRTIQAASHGTCGAPRVHAELRAESTAAARKRVARLMRQAGLRGVSRCRFR